MLEWPFISYALIYHSQDFVLKKKDYLLTQVGNPDGPDKPNKKFYDPRVWVREGEKTLVERVKEACSDLANVSEYPSHQIQV